MNQSKELEALREITKLNPIAFMKVTLARKEAEAFRDVYNKYEPGEDIEADYTTADNLEHALRKHALLKK